MDLFSFPERALVQFRLVLGFCKRCSPGLFTLIHYWVEYPPVFPWLATCLFLLSALAGHWAQPLFYLLTLLVLVAADSGCLLLVYRIAWTTYGEERLATTAAVIQALLFTPVYLYTGWFDTLPTYFFLAALWQILQNRSVQVSIWASTGALTKFFPGVALIVAWLHFQPPQRIRLVVSAVVTVLVILFPLVVLGPEMTVASLRGYLSRPSWETIWALLDGYYGSGGHPSPETRFDPNAQSWIQHPSLFPSWLPTAFFVLTLLWVLFRIPRLQGPDQVIALTGFLSNVLLLTSKGYSPQYLTWVMPFVALLSARRPIWLLIGAGLMMANLVEYPVYFHFFPDKPVVLAAAVLVRSSLLFVASVLQWRMVWGN